MWIGLRRDILENENKENKENLDFKFKKIRDLVFSSRKENGLQDLERYNNVNNKFNINVDMEQQNINGLFILYCIECEDKYIKYKQMNKKKVIHF